MENLTKHWILLSISMSSRERGCHIMQLYESRPDFVKDELNEFLNRMNNLESEKLIEKNPKSPLNYKLTKEGKKILDSYMQKTNFFEYIKFARLIPVFEMRFRLKLIESFLGNIVFIIFLIFIMYFLAIQRINNKYLSIIIISLFIASGFIVLSSGILIFVNFLYSLISNISQRFKEFINENYDKISTFIVVLFLVIAFFI